MAADAAATDGGSVDCSAPHVRDYALEMLRAAAAAARGLAPGDVLPISVFLERERENKHVSQQIFNKVRGLAFTFAAKMKPVLCLKMKLNLAYRLCSTRAQWRGPSFTTSRSGPAARCDASVGARTRA